MRKYTVENEEGAATKSHPLRTVMPDWCACSALEGHYTVFCWGLRAWPDIEGVRKVRAKKRA